MASSNFFVSIVLFVSLMALQSAAEARTLLVHQPSSGVAVAQQLASSSSSSIAAGGRNRKMMAAPGAVASMAAAAPLPADTYVVASPCPPVAPAGTAATAVFTVGSSVNPQVFKEVAIQVDMPKVLWSTAQLSCQTSTGSVITCDKPDLSPAHLAESDVVSTACMLGDLAVTGAVTCTLSYKVPAAQALATSSVDARQVIGAITFAPLAANVAEDSMNNAAATCVSAAS